MAYGYSLTGVDPNDPIPGILREILFAQGQGSGTNPTRTVLIYGNKTSAGSETADTIGDPVQSRDDCITRFGRRSEARWMYEAYVAIDPDATIYICAPAEHGSGTASTVTFTFAAGAASARTNLIIEAMGRSTTVSVETGDTAIAQAAAFAAAINDWEDSGMPFTAAAGNSPNDHIVTVTTANVGTRSEYVLSQLRARYQTTVTTTCTKAAVTAGTNDDDFTAAYTAAEAAGEFYYQINPKFTTSSASATDNGVGEGAAYITSAALPNGGKGQQMIFGMVGTNSQATTVATSVNNARCKFWWAENNPYWPGMLAATMAAVQRVQEMLHPGANFNGYTNSDSTPFYIPAPYSTGDRPTKTEVRSALNNGVSVIDFTTSGQAFVVRHITSRSHNGTAGQNDYRVREGHIPSAMDFFWAELNARYSRQKAAMPFVAADPPTGQKPKAKTMYPSSVSGIVRSTITDLSGPFIDGAPVLDEGALTEMLASVSVIALNDGYSVKCNPKAVRHNNKGQFRIEESSAPY